VYAILQRIEELAYFSVARGSAFAMLAIFVAMVGLIDEPALSLKTGAVLSLLACMTLLLKAAYAGQKHYRSTELWLLLKAEERPSERMAQAVVARVLREAYLRFAFHFAAGSFALLIFMIVAGLVLGPPVR
jgi:hypothetical protein